MQKIYQLLDKASKTDAAVLITGEKGVGKSMCARHIHDASSRQGKPFVIIKAEEDNAAIEEFISKACHGALFINEVAHLQNKHQKKLEKALIKAESHKNFRLIASTSVHLEKLVKNGKFPEHLYYLLSVIQIRIPPLRERKEDIPPLIDYLTEAYSNKHGRTCQFEDESKKKLASMPWKGNITELENYVRSVFSASSVDSITLKELEKFGTKANSVKSGDSISSTLYNIASEFLGTAKQSSTYIAFESYKKMVMSPIILAALHATKGNKSMSAKLLGINRNTLKKIIRDYNIAEQ